MQSLHKRIARLRIDTSDALMEGDPGTSEVHDDQLPKQFPHCLQNPAKGCFDFNSLDWSDRAITKGPQKGSLEKEAFIPTSRLNDFKQGRLNC